MSLNQALLQLIECPVCLKYMRFPIFLCTGGHSICNVCRPTMTSCPLCRKCLTNTRNYTLETINEMLEFPCDNADAGCLEFVRVREMNEHLKQCIYRKYNCRQSNCPWKGERSKLLNHYVENHKACVINYKNKNKFVWRDGISPSHELYLIPVHEDVLFFFHRKVVNNVMHFALQYIGKSEDVIQFYFKLRIYTSEYVNREIVISEICNPDVTEDINDIIENEYSIAVPINYWLTFANDNRNVLYSLQLLDA